jgi:alpha-methylacyl-CoA racemase
VPLNIVGDFGGGALYLTSGVLAALLAASRSGRGQVVDAAIVDGVSSLATMTYEMLEAGAWRDERGVNLLDGGAPWYDVYQTSDGQWMAVGAIEEKFFAEFTRLLGLEGISRPDPELRDRIAAAFASRTRAEWASVFEGTDACVAPVLSLTEAPGHPHLQARGTFSEGQPAPAPRFSGTPSAAGRPPAEPGEHTREALLDWGVPEVDALIESGAAIQP